MFRIKICGITNTDDAVAAVEAGAEAIGLNFYPKSPRYLNSSEARAINIAIAGRAATVGVFVNSTTADLMEVFKHALLSGVQLHGDEPPSTVAAVGNLLLFEEFANSRAIEPRLIRARRLGEGGIRAIELDLYQCKACGRAPHAILVDAAVSGAYGGTGATVDWEALTMHQTWLGDTPMILAGGLTPDNVAEAIRIVRPAAVDVASGVESAPGKKDPHKVRDFIAAARAAFDD